ncbi:hypothetical protein [Rhabdothermincola salaria]|uniref:hypothetical protein n=1 Tax=Rhabdothermincola salaria TaxID=2903142 RepID=UPI001E4F00B9|nr:hypothetical protein [Rhabdothermincola salaria]MCD9622977.1 hypothetical protein [Rhabdothermincola salaria]
MATTGSTTYHADRLYLVGDVGPAHPTERPTWAPTREQAWEAVRVRILDDLSTAPRLRCAAYRLALDELDSTGPQDDGWSVAVDDRAYFYRPHAVGRPASLTRGEAALLLALAVTG